MRVLINVTSESNSVACDVSFVAARKSWLSGTGLYIEFVPELCLGSDDFVFGVFSPSQKDVLVYRYSNTKFFINLISSGVVVFYVKKDGRTIFSEEVRFNVVELPVSLVYSFPYLLDLSVSDIRFFCNKLSECCVNGTRLILFTPQVINKLLSADGLVGLNKYLDMIFSIITERGLSAFVTLFDEHTIYTDDLLGQLKKYTVEMVSRFQKFKVFWDISCGTPLKYMKSTVDALISKTYKQHLKLFIPDAYNTSHLMVPYLRFIDDEDELENCSVVRQIYRIKESEDVVSCVKKVCSLGQGVEYVSPATSLFDVNFDTASLLYSGYVSLNEKAN